MLQHESVFARFSDLSHTRFRCCFGFKRIARSRVCNCPSGDVGARHKNTFAHVEQGVTHRAPYRSSRLPARLRSTSTHSLNQASSKMRARSRTPPRDTDKIPTPRSSFRISNQAFKRLSYQLFVAIRQLHPSWGHAQQSPGSEMKSIRKRWALPSQEAIQFHNLVHRTVADVAVPCSEESPCQSAPTPRKPARTKFRQPVLDPTDIHCLDELLEEFSQFFPFDSADPCVHVVTGSKNRARRFANTTAGQFQRVRPNLRCPTALHTYTGNVSPSATYLAYESEADNNCGWHVRSQKSGRSVSFLRCCVLNRATLCSFLALDDIA